MATFAQVVVLPQGEASGRQPQLDVRELRLADGQISGRAILEF